MLRLIKYVPRFARPLFGLLRGTLGKVLGAISGFFIVKQGVETTIDVAGRSVVESMSNSLAFVVFVSAVLALFAISFFSRKTLLNKKVSMLVLGVFCVVVFTSKPVAKEFKKRFHSKEYLYSKMYAQKKVRLKEVYRALKVKNKQTKNELLTTLIKGKRSEERELFKAVIKDNVGLFKNVLNREKITLLVVQYGNVELLDFLHQEGVLELNKKIEYKRSGMLRFIFTDKYLTALEIAKLEGKKEMKERLTKLTK